MSDIPKISHESIVCGLTEQPEVNHVLMDAINEIEKYMQRRFGLSENVKLCGIMLAPLWRVYLAGERRGEARSRNDATALFPIPEPEALK